MTGEGFICGDSCRYFDKKYRWVLGHWNLYVDPTFCMKRKPGESIDDFKRRARKKYGRIMAYRTWWRTVAVPELDADGAPK